MRHEWKRSSRILIYKSTLKNGSSSLLKALQHALSHLYRYPATKPMQSSNWFIAALRVNRPRTNAVNAFAFCECNDVLTACWTIFKSKICLRTFPPNPADVLHYMKHTDQSNKTLHFTDFHKALNTKIKIYACSTFENSAQQGKYH
jgi:hypothetical protein